MIALGSANIGVGLAVRLSDQFTNRATSVVASMGAMQAKVNQLHTTSLRGARNIGFVAAVVGTLLTAGFGSATKAASDFEWTMTTVAGVSEGTEAQMKKLEERALSLSKTYTFSAMEIASGMEYLGRAGMDRREIDGLIESATKLGTALDHSLGGIGGTADIVTNTMTRFNIPLTRADEIVDILAKSTTSANIQLSMLNESLKYSALSAYELGVPIEDLTAMISVMGNAGLQGGIAGRSLNQMLVQLSKTMTDLRSRKKSRILQAIGLDPNTLRDAKGGLKPLTDVFATVMDHIMRMPKPEQVSVLQDLFNIRGARAILPQLRNSMEMGRTFADQLDYIRKNAAGSTDQLVKMRMETQKGLGIRLRDNLKDLGIQIGKALLPILKIIVPLLIKFVGILTKFAASPVGKVFIVMAAGAGILLAIMGTLTAVMATIRLTQMAVAATGVTMGRALTSAWLMSERAAARYAATAAGASWVGPGGSFTMKGMRGMQSGKSLARGAGMTGYGGMFGLGKLFTGLGSLGQMAWGVAKVLARLISPIMFFVTILGALVGFKNVWTIFKYALGSIINGLIILGKVVSSAMTFNWARIPGHFTEFTNRQKLMREKLFGKKGNLDYNTGATFGSRVASTSMVGYSPYGIQGQEASESYKQLLQDRNYDVNIYLDGQKVGGKLHKVITDKERSEFLTGALQ